MFQHNTFNHMNYIHYKLHYSVYNLLTHIRYTYVKYIFFQASVSKHSTVVTCKTYLSVLFLFDIKTLCGWGKYVYYIPAR